MDNSAILKYFDCLDVTKQDILLKEFQSLCKSGSYVDIIKMRGNALDDRRGECPYCNGYHYIKAGVDKNSRRYKCKDCKRTFTEFTGSWLAGIHKKQRIPAFLKTLELNLSLVKTGKDLSIDPGTAFRWRHRFLSAMFQETTGHFKGITESDETFYLHSQKGKKCVHRPPRSRSEKKGAGITKEYATVLTTQDRAELCVSKFTNMGRITKSNIKNTIGSMVDNRTVFCSDGHRSFTGFSKDLHLEHHVLNSSKNQRVKGTYHIQHINSLHSRLKTFCNVKLKGVSTKYLQKYLNWQTIKDSYRKESNWVVTFLKYSMKRSNAIKIYNNIQTDYDKIFITTLNAS